MLSDKTPEIMADNFAKQMFVRPGTKLTVFIVIFLIFDCFIAAKRFAGEQVFLSITPVEAQEMLASRKNILFIDVRTVPEIIEISVEGAQSIPMLTILKGQAVLPKDKPILLICAVGGRSYWVGRFLSYQGYPEVYNLKGGIVAWEKDGLAVVKK